MRRFALLSLPMLLVATLLGGVAVANNHVPGSDPEGDTPGHPDVFHLVGLDSTEVVLPAAGGPPVEDEEAPPSVGDRLIVRENLFAFDAATGGPTGEQIGATTVECTATRVDPEVFSADVLCHGVVTLPRGMITFQALLTFAEETTDVVLPITGGSGLYADAGGRIILTFPEDGEEGEEEEPEQTLYEVRLLHLALQP